jgi:hypothetical protein
MGKGVFSLEVKRLGRVVLPSAAVNVKHNKQNHNIPAHRPYKHYMIYHLFVQVTHTDLRISLMMADCFRNM